MHDSIVVVVSVVTVVLVVVAVVVVVELMHVPHKTGHAAVVAVPTKLLVQSLAEAFLHPSGSGCPLHTRSSASAIRSS